MTDLWFILCLVVFVIYAVFIFAMVAGWSRRKIKYLPLISDDLRISLLVPFRNEIDHLPAFLESLKNQDVPNCSLEIIFIDDHSIDNSFEFIHQHRMMIPFPVQLLSLEDGKTGKREALHRGLKVSHGSCILTTDADCTLHTSWLQSMLKAYSGTYPMVCGPVFFKPSGNLIEIFQSLEMTSVMAVTAGSSLLGIPQMANGANLLIRKEDFLSYFSDTQPPTNSGDDMWLLFYMKKKYPGQIFFNLSKEAVVTTSCLKKIPEIIRQRRRWTSKSIYYKDPVVIFTGLLITTINLLWLAGVFIIPFHNPAWKNLLFFTFGKLFVDLLLLFRPLKFFNSLHLLIWVPLLEIIYPWYTGFLTLALLKQTFHWKGRIIH